MGFWSPCSNDIISDLCFGRALVGVILDRIRFFPYFSVVMEFLLKLKTIYKILEEDVNTVGGIWNVFQVNVILIKWCLVKNLALG